MSTYAVPYTGQQVEEYLAKARDFAGVPIGDGIYSAGKIYTALNQYLVDNGGLYKVKDSVTLPYAVNVALYPSASSDPSLLPYENFELDQLAAVARSLNVTGSQVIYATDITTPLDNILYIYDGVAEVTYNKPVTATTIGEKIVSLVGTLLTTTVTTYVLNKTESYIVNPNMLQNSHFRQPSPDPLITPPSATPEVYNAGDQVFLNYFVSAGGATLTQDPITKLVNVTAGSIYQDVPKSGALGQYAGPLVASWGDSTGAPTEDASVGFTDETTNYRITLAPSNVFSCKFEQGVVASRHGTFDESIETQKSITSNAGLTVAGTVTELVGVLIEGIEKIRIFNNTTSVYDTFKIVPIPRATRTVASIDLDNLTITQNPGDTCSLVPVDYDDDATDLHATVNRKSKLNSLLLPTDGNNGIASLSIMGDSISHGAFSGDVYRNNWTNIVKRFLMNEYDQDSYGYVSLQWPLTGAGPDSVDIIGDPSVSGGWSTLTLENASHTISGFAYSASAIGETISFIAPVTQQFISIWYYGQVGGGTFDVSVNGAVVKTIDTSIRSGVTFESVSIDDDGFGNCLVEIETTTAGNVQVSGVSLAIGSLFRPAVNNFSQSGRRFAYTDDEIINTLTKSQVLIFALGHNDQPNVSNPVYAALFIQKIDRLIEKCNENECQLYIQDFVWTSNERSLVRRELRRLHFNVKQSRMVAWPDMFKPDSSNIDGNYLINTIEMWDDGSHPNIEGHKMIGEVMSTKLRGTGNTKRASLNYDFWKPLKIVGIFKNVFSGFSLVSAVRGKPNTQLRLSFQKIDGTSFNALNDELICTLPDSDYYPSFTINEPITEASGGGVITIGWVKIKTDGQIVIETFGAVNTSSLNVNITIPNV